MLARSFTTLTCTALLLLACKKETPADQVSSAGARSSAVRAPAPPPSQPKPPRPADAIAETGAGLTSLSVDDTHLFWASNGYRGSTKGVLSVAKAGGDPTKLANLDQAQGIWATKGQLYFYDAGPRLWTMPKTGGKAVSLFKGDELGAAAADADTFCWIGPREREVAGEKSVPVAPAASVQRKKVFKSDERSIECRKDGNKEGVHVAPATLFVMVMLVAGDQVFWPSSLDGTIQAAPVAGGRERRVVREVNGVMALAANKRFLYFIGVHRKEQGLFAVDRKGGAPKKVVTLPVLSRQLVADEANAYYAIKGGLWRVPLRTGKQEPLLLEPSMVPAGIAADESNVYLADGFYLRRLKKP